jgi:hydroxymethylpyrimidine/phosphomethylpyrimidine kinase
MSDGLLGGGPWYCARHFSKLHGMGDPVAPARNSDGLITTPVIEEMRKLLKPQNKAAKPNIAEQLERIREPLAQEEPGANG